MNKLNIEPLELDNVSIFLKDENDGVCIVLSGEIDMRDPTIDVLPYLLKIHDEVINQGITNVKADFINLTFMNSSGLQTMINWIMKLNDVPEENRYKINVIYNSEITWQASSLPVLQRLLPDFILVETVEE